MQALPYSPHTPKIGNNDALFLAESYPEDSKFGPRISQHGAIHRPESEREAMLMVTRGNSANYYPSFTGYFLGFEYYAKKSKPMNLQLYRCVV